MKKQIFTLMMLCGLFGTAMSPSVSVADTKYCSEKSLQGAYGFAFQGTAHPVHLTPKTHPYIHYVAISGIINFDGKGGFVSDYTKSVNGKIVERKGRTGAYFVEGNCTGSAEFDDGMKLNASAGERRGNTVEEIFFIGINPGIVGTGTAHKQSESDHGK